LNLVDRLQLRGEPSRASNAAPAAQNYSERRGNGMACSFANFDLSRVAFIAE
jgi:hypothetical protein